MDSKHASTFAQPALKKSRICRGMDFFYFQLLFLIFLLQFSTKYQQTTYRYISYFSFLYETLGKHVSQTHKQTNKSTNQ